MSDESTSAPATPAQSPATAPGQGDEAGGLTPEAVEAIQGAESLPPAEKGAAPKGEAVKIAEGLEVPRAQLVELLQGEQGDAILREIKRTVRANGEDVEVSLLDALGEVPKARGWQRRMYEAAQKERQLEQAMAGIGKDPIGVIAKQQGVTREQAADLLAQQALTTLERQAMDPQARAELEAREEMERKAKGYEELQEKERQRKLEAEAEQWRERLTSGFHAALEAQGLPKTKHALARMAGLIGAATDRGVIKGDPTPDDYAWAAERVAEEVRAEQATMLDAEGDELISRLGEDVALKVARAVAARYRKTAPPDRQPGVERKTGRRDPSKIRNWSEWREQANRRMR